jgi:hypothetical protein
MDLEDVVREYVYKSLEDPEQLVALLMKPRAQQVADLRALARAMAEQRRLQRIALDDQIAEAKVRLDQEAADLEAI